MVKTKFGDRIMIKAVVILICSLLVCSDLYADEYVEQLLKSDVWQERDEATAIILRNLGKYKDDEIIKKGLMDILNSENEYIRDLEERNEFANEEGRGQHYVQVVDLVILLDIPGSTKVLLDSAGMGTKVKNKIVDNLLKESDEYLDTFYLIQEKAMSNEKFYKQKQEAYIDILNLYLEKKKKLVSIERKNIAKSIVKQGLISKSPIAIKYAIRCSKHFGDDKEIINQIKKIEAFDENFIVRFGKKEYLLRNEARKILNEIKE